MIEPHFLNLANMYFSYLVCFSDYSVPHGTIFPDWWPWIPISTQSFTGRFRRADCNNLVTLKRAGHLAFFLCWRGSFCPHALAPCAGASDTNIHRALQGGPAYQQNKSPSGRPFFCASAILPWQIFTQHSVWGQGFLFLISAHSSAFFFPGRQHRWHNTIRVMIFFQTGA